MRVKSDFEIYCYETEDGQICLEFDEYGIGFSKKMFLDFADQLIDLRDELLIDLGAEKQKANFNNESKKNEI